MKKAGGSYKGKECASGYQNIYITFRKHNAGRFSDSFTNIYTI